MDAGQLLRNGLAVKVELPPGLAAGALWLSFGLGVAVGLLALLALQSVFKERR